MKTSRRKWLLAGFLNILALGLGQVYNGQLKKGVLFYIIDLVLASATLLCMLVIMRLSRTSFIISLVLLLAVLCTVRIYMIVDAIIYARKQEDSYQLKAYNRWYVYLGVILLSQFILRPILTSVFRENRFEAHMVPSDSMIPAIKAWDFVFIDKTVYHDKLPLRTDVIVIAEPKLDKKFIRRVIGLPGDTVRIEKNEVFINNMHIDEPYVSISNIKLMNNPYSSKYNFGPEVVPEDQLFILEDNRSYGLNCPGCGFINVSQIDGKVRVIYFSFELHPMRICWERIGLAVR